MVMEKYLTISALTACLLLMTVKFTVKCDEDDSGLEDSGWFQELCLLAVSV